jgi:hypothetical protein
MTIEERLVIEILKTPTSELRNLLSYTNMQIRLLKLNIEKLEEEVHKLKT